MNYTIITKRDCPWCDKVKEEFDTRGLKYELFVIEEATILLRLLKSMGFKTVPQVFANGYSIGGYEDTKTYLEMEDMLDVEDTD